MAHLHLSTGRTTSPGCRTSSIVPIASTAAAKLPVDSIAFFLHLLELLLGGLLPLLGFLLLLLVVLIVEVIILLCPFPLNLLLNLSSKFQSSAEQGST